MTEHTCDHPWCIAAGAAEVMCTCPYSDQFPHRAADCARRDAGTTKPTDARPAGQERAR